MQALPAVGGGTHVSSMRTQIQILLSEVQTAEGKQYQALKLLQDAQASSGLSQQTRDRICVALFTLQSCSDPQAALQSMFDTLGKRDVESSENDTGHTLCLLLCAQLQLRIEDVPGAELSLNNADKLLTSARAEQTWNASLKEAGEGTLWNDLRRSLLFHCPVHLLQHASIDVVQITDNSIQVPQQARVVQHNCWGAPTRAAGKPSGAWHFGAGQG
jgi:hypothetical protein